MYGCNSVSLFHKTSHSHESKTDFDHYNVEAGLAAGRNAIKLIVNKLL